MSFKELLFCPLKSGPRKKRKSRLYNFVMN